MTANTDMFDVLWGKMGKEEHSYVRKKIQQGDARKTRKRWKDQAVEILEFLNERTGRSYRSTETNLKFIMQRLESGITPDQCRQIIVRKQKEWKGTSAEVYLRPATLFNQTKCEQYIGELI